MSDTRKHAHNPTPGQGAGLTDHLCPRRYVPDARGASFRMTRAMNHLSAVVARLSDVEKRPGRILRDLILAGCGASTPAFLLSSLQKSESRPSPDWSEVSDRPVRFSRPESMPGDQESSSGLFSERHSAV